MHFVGFDHIDLRVADLAAERPLYDALLPALGLTEIVESAGTCEYYEPAERGEARRFFGLNADPGHRANATRICFAAASASEVDRLADIARMAGARGMEGPEIPYSSEKYYAVFFEDRSGNKLEIAYRRPHLVPAAALLDEAGRQE
ncbi:MAG: VOC family protein [Candidatus Velthaea sp.]|jgi:catechol 2,3-dioxygenase-like lactoylglutathione lyase family enzyme